MSHVSQRPKLSNRLISKQNSVAPAVDYLFEMRVIVAWILHMHQTSAAHRVEVSVSEETKS